MRVPWLPLLAALLLHVASADAAPIGFYQHANVRADYELRADLGSTWTGGVSGEVAFPFEWFLADLEGAIRSLGPSAVRITFGTFDGFSELDGVGAALRDPSLRQGLSARSESAR